MSKKTQYIFSGDNVNIKTSVDGSNLLSFYPIFIGSLEAATRGVLWKKVFLEISQNSYEETKKETLAQVFSCEFCEILRTPFLQNTSGRLLLEAWLFLHKKQVQKFISYFSHTSFSCNGLLFVDNAISKISCLHNIFYTPRELHCDCKTILLWFCKNQSSIMKP